LKATSRLLGGRSRSGKEKTAHERGGNSKGRRISKEKRAATRLGHGTVFKTEPALHHGRKSYSSPERDAGKSYGLGKGGGGIVRRQGCSRTNPDELRLNPSVLSRIPIGDTRRKERRQNRFLLKTHGE